MYFLVYVFRFCSHNPFSFACQPRRVQSLRTDFANRNTTSPLLSHLTLFKKHLSIQSRLGKKRPRKTFNCTQLPTVGIKHNETPTFLFFQIRPLLKFTCSARQSSTLAQIYVEQRLQALLYFTACWKKRSVSSAVAILIPNQVAVPTVRLTLQQSAVDLLNRAKT